MISYKKCAEVSMDKVYEAFTIGFSDYIIKMEIPKELFVKRFFGPEGNELDLSFIALDDDKPVGVILGGMGMFEGIKTMRCGTLCVHPDYRGKNISRKLFELHKKTAIENSCKQLFLEVIVGNDRAISFYKNMGYDIVYSLSYFSHEDPKSFYNEISHPLYVEKAGTDMLNGVKDSVKDIHITWQNSFDYMDKMDDVYHFTVRNSSETAGAISVHKSGKIYFLWVHPSFRNQGLGKSLVGYAAQELDFPRAATNFANNGNLEGFYKHLGFKRDSISQYEMYLTL